MLVWILDSGTVPFNAACANADTFKASVRSAMLTLAGRQAKPSSKVNRADADILYRVGAHFFREHLNCGM